MKSIQIPIFHLNDRTESMRDAGVNYDYQECDIKNVTFYNIDAIGVDKNMGKEYGLIFSGGTTFTSSLAYGDLKLLLSE